MERLAALSDGVFAVAMTLLVLDLRAPAVDAIHSDQERSDRSLARIHIAFLLFVSILPFATTLLAEFPEYRVALLAYWLNILFLGAALYFNWVCAAGTGLVKSDMPAHVSSAIKKRIVIAQALYAFGALLCVVNTYWSTALIIAVQLNYAIAPRFRRG